jgi:hypothetical protein
MKRSLTILFGFSLIILLAMGCATHKHSKTGGDCNCNKSECKCSEGKTGSECGGCAEGECNCSKAAASCAGCKPLVAGQTGWCEDCGKGFFEGKEVNCVGGCKANPGGPPCTGCVK